MQGGASKHPKNLVFFMGVAEPCDGIEALTHSLKKRVLFMGDSKPCDEYEASFHLKTMSLNG
jgi:hypothetical protein